MTRIVLATMAVLAAWVLIVTWSQDDIIFPTRAVPEAGPLPTGAERMRMTSASGETLHGVHVPPSRRGGGSKLMVLGFGGNAWNAEDVASYLHEVYPQAHVVTFHYRGYRPSGGTPSAKALLADAPLVYDAAVERVRPDKRIVAGFSIGSGVAASLAQQRPIDGLILVTPFDSLGKVAGSLYPWLPVGAFFQHEIDAAAALRGSHVPVAIIAAEKDEIIPPARTEALRKQVPNLVFDSTIRGAGHNDIYGRSNFQAAMDEAMSALVAG